MMNQNVMRDPLRAGMEARAHGLPKLLLGVAAVLVFFALEMKNCAGMEGAAAVALIGAACMALLTFGAWRALKEQPVMVLLCAAMLAMLAVAAHLTMLDIKPGRVSKVLAPMLEEMWNYDLGTAMAWEDGAWSGGYLIVMALISRLENFSQLYAVKLVDMVCQTAAALAVLKLALTRNAKPGTAVGAMFACVLAPTMLMNGGCWAQCDAMFAALTLWGLALLLGVHPVWGCMLWGLAAATKLQAAFLFPLLLVFFMKGKVSVRHLLAGLAAFVLMQAAFLMDGQGLAAVFGRYAQQINEMAYEGAGLADHAAGVYSLMTVASVREFSGMGMCAAGRLCADPRACGCGRGHAAAGGAAAGGGSAADSAADERAQSVSGGHAGLCLRGQRAAAGDCRGAGIDFAVQLYGGDFQLHDHPDERAQPDGDCLRDGHSAGTVG